MKVEKGSAPVHNDFTEDGFLCRLGGAANYSSVKADFTKTTDPGVTDDSSAGWSVGSRWTNVTLDKIWECIDASVGAAIWKDLSRVEQFWLDATRFEAGGALAASFFIFGFAPIWDFADGVNRQISVGIVLPERFPAGGQIDLFLWWSANGTASAGEIARWRLLADFFGDGDLPSQVIGSYANNIVADLTLPTPYTVNELVPKSGSADFSFSGGNPGDLLVMNLRRNGGATEDTLGDVATFYGMEMRYG